MRKLIIFLFILFSFNINSDIGSELKNIENWYAIDLRRRFFSEFYFYEYAFKNKNFTEQKVEIYFRFTSHKKNECIIKKDDNFSNVKNILSRNNIKEKFLRQSDNYLRFTLKNNRVSLEQYIKGKYKKSLKRTTFKINQLIKIISQENKILMGEDDGICFNEMVMYTPNRTVYLNLSSEKLENEMRLFYYLTKLFNLDEFNNFHFTHSK